MCLKPGGDMFHHIQNCMFSAWVHAVNPYPVGYSFLGQRIRIIIFKLVLFAVRKNADKDLEQEKNLKKIGVGSGFTLFFYIGRFIFSPLVGSISEFSKSKIWINTNVRNLFQNIVLLTLIM